jgi:hypothetical protein
MSNMTMAAIVTPIIAAVALAFWLVMVFRADAHPLYKHQSNRPPGDVSGGSFSAEGGGRQLMPRPDARPTARVPEARSASEHEQYPPEAAQADQQSSVRLGQTWSACPVRARPCYG